MTRGPVRHMVALAVLVVVLAAAGGGAHAHAAPRIDAAPGVLGASLGDALAPGSGAGAMFAMEGSELMLVEESTAFPDMFKNAHDVFGMALSVSVPVLNPRVSVRVSVDGKAFKIAEKIKVLGSLTVAIEVDVFGLFSMYAGVTGSAVLNSKTHESVIEMLEDLGRHMLRLHERDLHNEVVRILDEVDKALVEGEKAGGALVDTAWGELKEYYSTVADDCAHWRENIGTRDGLRGAVELFDIDTLREGEWWSAPMQYRTKVGVLVAAPFLRPAGEVGTALERVFEANGMNETMYDRILNDLGSEGTSSDDVGAGTLGIFVLDTHMSRDGGAAAAPKVKAYVQFESDIAKVATRTVEGEPPSYFEDVALPIGNRNKLAHVKVQLREAGMVMDSTLAEMQLDLSLFTDANKVVPLTLRGKTDDGPARVEVVARWLPYRKNDALSHIGLPNEKGVMRAETGAGGKGRALELTRVPGPDGEPRWEYSRWLAKSQPCSAVEEETRVGSLFGKKVELGLRPQELLLCHYLARANPAVPTNDEHVGVLLQDLLINHIGHVFEAVQPHVDPLMHAMTKVMVELHAAEQVIGTRSRRATRTRATAAVAMRALEKALRAKVTKKSKAAFVKASTDIMKKHVQRLRQELHVASQKLNVEKLAAFPKNGLAREMQVDFAYFFQLGGRVTTGDLTVKAAAGVAGKGLRGTIKPDEFYTQFVQYDLALGGVQVSFDGEWRLSVTAMHRAFHDKTQSVVLGIELQAPGDELAADTYRIRRLPTGVDTKSSMFEKLDAVIRVCELAAAGTEIVTGDDPVGRTLEEVHGIAFDTLFDAVVSATRKKVATFVASKMGTGKVKRGVMPGVVMRLFLSADKAGKWSRDPRASHAFLYLMDKAEVSLAKALGPIGGTASKLAGLKVAGAMENGLWWSFGGDKGGEAPHAMETLFHGV